MSESKSQEEESQIYQEIMACKEIGGVPGEAALDMIAKLIDVSSGPKRAAGTIRALQWCEQLEHRQLSSSQRALLSYFRANAWGNRRRYKHSDRAKAWSWDQPELQEEILHLRTAVTQPGFGELPPVRRCQILTNLGNALNIIGRFVEAIEYWDRALDINPGFGMALGNRGYGLECYGRALYDGGHRAMFLREASEALTSALSPAAEYETAYDEGKAFFAQEKARIEAALEVQKVPRLTELGRYAIGRGDPEKRYRRWCLRNRLFLNPLNDLGHHEAAAHDVLLLPSFATPFEDPPTLIGFFNQMKQEFVSARWIFYEGSHTSKVHFSDRHVSLYNTLDYPSYALAVEKVKAAYRMAYSIFDKIAFFLNKYMALGLRPKEVYFKTIWYPKGERGQRSIRREFAASESWALRGIFWLSKDFFDEKLRATTEPDALELYEIRNHIEHKHLKIHDMLPARRPLTADPLAYSIHRRELEAKTLRLLKLSRAGLIYLSLGMHADERRREKARDAAQTVEVGLELWKDEWKR